jgi:hypothetical protein
MSFMPAIPSLNDTILAHEGREVDPATLASGMAEPDPSIALRTSVVSPMASLFRHGPARPDHRPEHAGEDEFVIDRWSGRAGP